MKKITKCTALALLWLWLIPQSVQAEELLVPGGQLIGIQMDDDRVTVAAFEDTLGEEAKKAGLQVGDWIKEIDSRKISSSDDVRQALTRSDGQVEARIQRDGKEKVLQLTPQITEHGPRLGVYLKEGVTGVGTVTWYDPQTGAFGALGHGVNAQEGELLKIREGSAYQASILWVKKGKAGTPGQLMGALDSSKPLGAITKNTSHGVFGTIEPGKQGEPLPLGETEHIHTGPAMIRTTVRDRKVQEYSVEILKIYPGTKEEGRNMLLKITDPRLLDTTGGIVQGMSGSPIVQDGKLIGAVTHVLVNDPTTGYGIFIENMLDAAA